MSNTGATYSDGRNYVPNNLGNAFLKATLQ